jgi:hypothetical protein
VLSALSRGLASEVMRAGWANGVPGASDGRLDDFFPQNSLIWKSYQIRSYASYLVFTGITLQSLGANSLAGSLGAVVKPQVSDRVKGAVPAIV